MATRTMAWMALAVSAAVAAGGVASGQNQDQPQAPLPTAGSPTSEPLGDLDFPGGTVAEYVAAVEKVFGVVNVVMNGDAATVSVVPVKLKSITRSNAMDVLDYIITKENNRHFQSGIITNSVHYISSWVNPPSNPPQLSPMMTVLPLRVWSLRGLVDGGARVEDMLSAVETALELIGDEPKIRYHKDTGLLIIQGWPAHLEAADQVLRSIDDAQRQAENAAARKAAESRKDAPAN